MLKLPKFVAAAVQAAPVFLDTPATIEKAVSLIREARANGADLIAFPEVFIPAYPYWSWITDPVTGGAWFDKLARAAITEPGPEVEILRSAAREAGIHVVIGINERSTSSIGTLYNTLLTIGPDGTLLGKHRKLMPTWAEKLTWAPGDGAGLKVHDTAIGPLGALACGENTNTLARFTLLAQGELVHVASYISLPVAPPDYDMAEAIKLRAMAHSFEGKVFTIVSCSTVSEEIIAAMEGVVPDARARLQRKSSAFSGVIGPDGRVVGEPLIDEEGIVYAEIDLGRCIQPKQMHDIVGHYNRFDVFDLRVSRRRLEPISLTERVQTFDSDDAGLIETAQPGPFGISRSLPVTAVRRSGSSMASTFRIGQIVPSSNTTMETEIPAIFRTREIFLPERFTFHSSRMRMKKVVKEELEAMNRDSDRCAIELSDARVDVLGYACLVAIMSMGKGYHRTSEARLHMRTAENGAPAPVVTSAGALVDGLKVLGAKKISVICPYMKPLTQLVVDYIEHEGIAVKDFVALEIPDNLEVGRHDPNNLLDIYKRVDTTGIDAFVASACVQMPSLPVIDELQKALGLPVVSASVCTSYQMMSRLGLLAASPGAGELLSGRY